mmetsp:Transcript_7957/g.11621  ORF Transcript_7957/g.11621 Transcript_7957/m.11621 type:complete len:111 (-) Transcript_7957:108-440(-)
MISCFVARVQTFSKPVLRSALLLAQRRPLGALILDKSHTSSNGDVVLQSSTGSLHLPNAIRDFNPRTIFSDVWADLSTWLISTLKRRKKKMNKHKYKKRRKKNRKKTYKV